MGTLIDSSVLVAWERDQLDLETQLADYAEEDFAISAITASELLHGVHRATTPARRNRREAFVEGLLSRLPIIFFDLVTARIHARLSAELAIKRTSVGPHDLIIAATALASDRTVITADATAFTNLPGVIVRPH